MVKRGGPCQAPGKTEGTICGETEIGDNSDWRRGGKHKPEHAGKWCCPKNKCRIALGVIPDPKAPKAEVAPAPAPAASGPLGGLLDAVSTALAGPPAPAAAPAAASASAASASAATYVRAGRDGGQAQRPRRGGRWTLGLVRRRLTQYGMTVKSSKTKPNSGQSTAETRRPTSHVYVRCDKRTPTADLRLTSPRRPKNFVTKLRVRSTEMYTYTKQPTAAE